MAKLLLRKLYVAVEPAALSLAEKSVVSRSGVRALPSIEIEEFTSPPNEQHALGRSLPPGGTSRLALLSQFLFARISWLHVALPFVSFRPHVHPLPRGFNVHAKQTAAPARLSIIRYIRPWPSNPSLTIPQTWREGNREGQQAGAFLFPCAKKHRKLTRITATWRCRRRKRTRSRTKEARHEGWASIIFPGIVWYSNVTAPRLALSHFCLFHSTPATRNPNSTFTSPHFTAKYVRIANVCGSAKHTERRQLDRDEREFPALRGLRYIWGPPMRDEECWHWWTWGRHGTGWTRCESEHRRNFGSTAVWKFRGRRIISVVGPLSSRNKRRLSYLLPVAVDTSPYQRAKFTFSPERIVIRY